MTGYGMTGYLLPPRVKFDFLDVYPSLMIAAAAYVRGTGDTQWNSAITRCSRTGQTR